MFGIWKRKEPIVLRHWYSVVLDFETSTQEFYDSVIAELDARRLTGLYSTRIDYAEGGLFSARRQYLRMQRERLVFDVCAAPFGTTWLFSCRFSVIPFTLLLWEILIVLVFVAGVEWFYASLFGWILGSIFFGASIFSLLLLLRSTVAMGFNDLDAALLQVPILGAFYEKFLRKNTYYREDTRLAYIDIVDSAVRAKATDLAKSKGVDTLFFNDVTPVRSPALMSLIGAYFDMRKERDALST